MGVFECIFLNRELHVQRLMRGHERQRCGGSVPEEVRVRKMTHALVCILCICGVELCQTHLRDISLELPAQLHQVLVGMFTLLLSTRQLRCYRI